MLLLLAALIIVNREQGADRHDITGVPTDSVASNRMAGESSGLLSGKFGDNVCMSRWN